MTFNYRVGLFRSWLVLSIFWVVVTAWAGLPVEAVIGVPLGLGLVVYAIVWALRGFGAKQRPPRGFFDLNELRLELASVGTQSPETYKDEIEPLLDLLQAQYGICVPNSEMDRIQQAITGHRERLAQQKKDIIDQAAAEGRTIEIDALRRSCERSQAEYQGQDRDAYANENNRFLDTLAAKYGNRIPIDEAYAILEKLEAKVGDPGDHEPMLDWTTQPGFHERRLLLRHNNSFFPPQRRRVSKQELSVAKQMDAEMLALFEKSAAAVVATFRNGESVPIENAAGQLTEIEELFDNGAGLGPRARVPLDILQIFHDVLQKVLEEGVDEASREQFRHSTAVIERMCQLRRHQAYIDVSRADLADRLPTFLSCNTEDLRFLFQELPPELADLSRTWQKNKEELRLFAIQLIDDSTEAKAKLLQEPDKLELLRITMPQGR